MKTNHKYSFLSSLLLAALLSTACNRLDQTAGDLDDGDFLSQVLDDKQEQMKAVDVSFSPDYKTFTVTADLQQDIGSYNLDDSTAVRSEVVETIDGLRQARYTTPSLLKIDNIEAKLLRESDIRLLVLVDLTLPQADLNHIRNYVGEMRTNFNNENLFVAFMDSNTVSSSIKVTDYVLTHYFVNSGHTYTLLYRSILQKRDEMLQHNDVWQDANRMVLLVFSNEKVYFDNSDRPIDPKHYRYQEQMAGLDCEKADSTFSAYYASFNHQQDDDLDDERNVLRHFCDHNHGAFIKDFKWVSFKNELLNTLQTNEPDYKFYFVNPDHKVYRGDHKELTINFYDTRNDSLITTFSTSVVKGEIFNPIIVHGHSLLFVLLQGFFLGLFLILLIYLILQIIVPFIRHRLFLRKYVVTYSGANMSVDNTVVAESCYLCKAPFEAGDQIVVKCEHTMHKSCWDENGYHCPEYSDRCKHGSHYYNPYHTFDHRNAPYYLKWFLTALVASTLAWICFSLYIDSNFDIPFYQLVHSSSTQIPIFGFFISFFLTFGITNLALRPSKDPRVWRHVLLRSCLAGIGSYASFMFINLIIYLFDIHTLSFLLNWIPWTLSGFIIVYSSSLISPAAFRQSDNPKALRFKHLTILISVLFGFLSMYAWTFLFRYMELDFRVVLLLSFIIFGVGLTACIATVVPRSERYFLKVQGAVKGMDLALYKWFRNCPERIVTLGKSVDCSLQLSWDIQSDIAPIQAEIRLIKQMPYLIPLEPGVYLGNRPARVGKKIRLYHSRSFSIGKTTFTYIEKDRMGLLSSSTFVQ